MDMYEATRNHQLHTENICEDDYYTTNSDDTNGSLALSIINDAMDNMLEIPFDSFIVDNDEKAEWSLKKIAEETADTNRYIAVCEKDDCRIYGKD